MQYNPEQFAEKYQLAQRTAQEAKPESGLCGFELEWNLLDHEFRPLLTVGAGPDQRSFVDYFRQDCLPAWVKPYTQLEVFHWMVEWVTRPFYTPRAAILEARLLEAMLWNGLHKAGQDFGEELYAWPGNLLFRPEIRADTIPSSWNLAKRRYLERCVDLYGPALATAGTHTNLSLPDPLLAWDFMHLAPEERTQADPTPMHLDDYKSQVYITLTRLMRAFACLFIAASASTPIRGKKRGEEWVGILTEFDSNRNLTFPNPVALDQPYLYRSYADYLNTSYDLIRRGVRFGNNNWTPVRARSSAEPVERLISVTSEQLHELYARGLYSAGQDHSVDSMAKQIELQNLMARINLPMARVEVRTDDGGGSLEIDLANLTLKHLLMLRLYADPAFGRAFRYDGEDIARARRNEDQAAQWGLRAQIEDPFSGKMISMRSFLAWILEEVRPLAVALGLWEDLAPLVEMAAGQPNVAEQLRAELRQEYGEEVQIPVERLKAITQARVQQVHQDVQRLTGQLAGFPRVDAVRLEEWLFNAQKSAGENLGAPFSFHTQSSGWGEVAGTDKTEEILSVAEALIRIPSVTACPQERLEEVRRAAAWIESYACGQGLAVRHFAQGKYPALWISFPGQTLAPVMLSGHFDVVEPQLDDRQFEPRREGDYLWGRGAADMKTVVASNLVWMKDRMRSGPPYPPVCMLLVGNEENGETELFGTPQVLARLLEETNGSYSPQILIAGERTGERGTELWGEICVENRGVVRCEIQATGQKGHSGTRGASQDMTERMIQIQQDLRALLEPRLTLSAADGWVSQLRFPFLEVGQAGVYNITAGLGRLGVEMRPIPQDALEETLALMEAYCQERGLSLQYQARENGVVCARENPYLQALVAAVEEVSGQAARIGRKLPGTSARFAPGGQGVIWGQTGIGPHAGDERHYIPSIEPYYRALERFAQRLME